MSAEKNQSVRTMAKALKRCNAMLASGESLQVVLIDAYFSGAYDALANLERARKPKRKRSEKK